MHKQTNYLCNVYKAYLQKAHDPGTVYEVYAGTRGTEPPFSGKYYNNCKDNGIYKCVCCGNIMFTSDTKFDSGTGWPSFSTPINGGSVKEELDISYGMIRTEVLCVNCGAHLGMCLMMNQSQPACAIASILYRFS
jgi:peptide-methionine (R)-S-oxide reductase